jgi:hypothetical protein
MDLPLVETRYLTESRGQTILTFLYLCVLGLCFLTAAVYFCRIQYEERCLRRFREAELQAMRSAISQSEATQREESLAVQYKYMEDRRARIRQLFLPVTLTLEMSHFHLDEQTKKAELEKAKRIDRTTDTEVPEENTYGDEDSLLVEIPTPGFHVSLGPNERPQTRLVAGMCTICLCTFDIGNNIVWSSNTQCEHVFHESCIEKWLMKQREGPLCPCCRRDFIVDPYDMETNVQSPDEDIPGNTRTQTIFARGMEGYEGEEEA